MNSRIIPPHISARSLLANPLPNFSRSPRPIIDITNENDNPPLPPFILEKSDGAILYSTTDLATILQRCEEFDSERMIYVVDNRQGTHFKQLFRTVEKTNITGKELDLEFSGFGTMNGKDGKPYKTREGGVMRLERLISEINEEMYQKIISGREVSEEEARETAAIVGLSAIKYGDLSNQASKDYIFDIDRFTSFEGDTGPYILYTAVRLNSVLKRATMNANPAYMPINADERNLFLQNIQEWTWES